MSNQYTPKQIADFIVKYVNDQEVKKELKKQGYNIVPNSLSKLIQNLESVGFIVTKKDTKQPQPEPVTENVQILGSKVNNPPPMETNSITNNLSTNDNVEESNEKMEKGIINPFGDGFLNSDTLNNIDTSSINEVQDKTKEDIKESYSQVEQPKTFADSQKDNKKTFNHFSPPEPEPENPMEKAWFQVRQQGKRELPIAFYSLIVNAKILNINENFIYLGFDRKHTYQMNQLKRENNMNTLKQLIKDVLGKSLEVQVEVISEDTTEVNNVPLEEKENKNDENIVQIFGTKN